MENPAFEVKRRLIFQPSVQNSSTNIIMPCLILKEGIKMGTFFIILMVLFIIIANMIAFIAYRKKNNFYFSAFILLLLAVFFGAIGGSLAVMVIRDPFGLFYGMQIGYFLLINSVIVLMVAIFATVIKKFNSSKM